MNDLQHINVAETLAREMKQPVTLIKEGAMAMHRTVVALPPGWAHHVIDESKNQPNPTRKLANVSLTETESYIGYVLRNLNHQHTLGWIEADYPKGKLLFTTIINDHGGSLDAPEWRDHRAIFAPEFSEEWKVWTKNNREAMTQVEFALFIEENLKDIAGVEGLPTGTQMLAMATDLEITQDSKFKASTRLQSGGTRIEFIEDDDAATVKRMEIFQKFAVGLQVFRNGQAYRVDARLRYRQSSGKLVFWYELVRPDITMEDASKDLIAHIREQIPAPFFFGKP